MTPSRWSFGRPLIIALLLITPAVVSSSTLRDRTCAGLQRWAEAYRGTRPTLEQFARFDRDERRAIANVLTPAVLAELWQEQLRRFSRRSELSAEQRALAREAVGLTTTSLYTHNATAREAADVFWRRAERAFSSADHRRAFLDLGAVAETPPPARTIAVACECNRLSPGANCGPLPCRATGCTHWTGCGTFGNLLCNGECRSLD